MLKKTSIRIPFLLLFCAVIASLPGQTAQIEKLKQEVESLEGPPEIRKMLQLSEVLFEGGFYEKSIDWAENAEKNAHKQRETELEAMALNRIGKGLAILNKKGAFKRNKAVPKFRSSLELLRQMPNPNTALVVDNLLSLRSIAEKAGEPDRVRELEQMMEQIRKNGAGGESMREGQAGKAEITETLTKLEQEKNALRQEIEKQLKQQQATQTVAAAKEQQWTAESKAMMQKLALQEEAISKMTEAQMKERLNYMQQRQLLDSLTYRSSLDSVNLVNTQLAVRASQTRNNFLAAAMAALFLLLGGSTFSFFRAKKHARELAKKNEQILAEQQRSEELLLNILPANVAKELKTKGFTDAQFFEHAAVLFVDFVGFSKIAAQISPDQLVADLDSAFKAFDSIMGRYGIEKIKTIGDAYMCASGLSNNSIKEPGKMIDAAREIQAWLKEWNQKREHKRLPRFDARVGIHTGPVVAGVVGSKKFAFDIWGDTVNVASRVEQAGEGGKINISGSLYALVKDKYPCQFRGSIPVKNMGDIEMYYVSA